MLLAETALTAVTIELFISPDIVPCIIRRLSRSTRFVGFADSNCSSDRLIEVPLGALHELAPQLTAIPLLKVIWLTKFARFSAVVASMMPNSGPSRPAEAGGA